MFHLPESAHAQESKEGPTIDPAAGCWCWDGNKQSLIILELDGNITETKRKGHWVCKNPGAKARQYVFTWEGQRTVDTVTLNEKGDGLTGTNQAKVALNLGRVGPVIPSDARLDSLSEDERGNRTWTDAKSGRPLEGRVLAKKVDSSEVQLASKEGGKSFWLKTALLSAIDQYYVRYWVRASANVSARIEASGYPGWKKVEATIQCGPQPMLVLITGDMPPPNKLIEGVPRPPIYRIVPAGEKVEIEFAAGTHYRVVVAKANDKVGDEETDEKKTEL